MITVLDVTSPRPRDGATSSGVATGRAASSPSRVTPRRTCRTRGRCRSVEAGDARDGEVVGPRVAGTAGVAVRQIRAVVQLGGVPADHVALFEGVALFGGSVTISSVPRFSTLMPSRWKAARSTDAAQRRRIVRERDAFESKAGRTSERGRTTIGDGHVVDQREPTVDGVVAMLAKLEPNGLASER